MAANIEGELHVPRRRNVMRAFKINEISAVDRPAQEGARAMIIKRNGADEPNDSVWETQVTKRKFTAEQRKELANSGAALPDGSYPIETKGDLANAISSFGRGGATPRIKAHIVRRAKALGATDSLPENWQVSKDGNDTDNTGAVPMTEKELQKKVDDLAAELAKVKTDSAAAATKAAELEKANAELTAKAAAAAEETETLKAKQKLTPQQQAFLDAQEGEAADADKKKAATKSFLALTPEARDKLIAEKRANDETITIEGQEVRKSEVGPKQFAIMKAQSERVAALEKDSKAAVEKAETAELTKRADDEFKHLPGTAEDKVGVLRVIGKADKKVQEVFTTMMKAGEKAIVSAFDKIGHRGGNPSIDKGAFEKRIAEVRARDNSSRTEAMEKARKEYPQEFEAYQGQN